jgi:hypothetical protein
MLGRFGVTGGLFPAGDENPVWRNTTGGASKTVAPERHSRFPTHGIWCWPNPTGLCPETVEIQTISV